MQTENLKCFFRLVYDNMSSYNLPSVKHHAISLCVRVGLCDVCADFTNLIKIDVDAIEYLTRNIRETTDSFARSPSSF